ncbi:MAG: hypothetical protein ACE5GM_11050, partial [bacterium]
MSSGKPAFAIPVGVGGIGAPLQTKIAKTLPKKKFLLFSQNEYLKFHRNLDRENSYQAFSDTHFGMAMGITDDIMLTLKTSAVYRSGKIAGDNKDLRGLGETRGLLQWRIKKARESENDPVSLMDVSFLLEIKAPTGDNREKMRGGALFPERMQLGSGSVDYSFGLAATEDLGDLDFSFSGLYTINDEDNNYRFGNVLELSSRISLNLVDQPRHTVSNFNLIGELTDFSKEKDVKNNMLLNATGGNVLYASAGVNAVLVDSFSIAALFQ